MKKIHMKGVDDVISAFIRGFAFGVNPIRLLFEIRNADEYTYTHMVNVCILTLSQAESLGFEGRHLYQIGVAAILHDAGKLLIPQEILNKPGKLTPKERGVIETHSAKGASFILSQKSVSKLAVIGALEHHIRYDGTGYPALSSGYKTNIVSQMISIADVFDAMRSRRPYKEPRPIEEILRILQDEKGATFNPMLVDNFIRLLAVKPD
jgi:HD-GYP domain-containing protein (c-di-GMP phosphodiesterase class II)